jgi:hypothetical protein
MPAPDAREITVLLDRFERPLVRSSAAASPAAPTSPTAGPAQPFPEDATAAKTSPGQTTKAMPAPQSDRAESTPGLRPAPTEPAVAWRDAQAEPLTGGGGSARPAVNFDASPEKDARLYPAHQNRETPITGRLPATVHPPASPPPP